MIARQLERRRERGKNPAARPKSGGPAGPGGWLTSFRGGLDVLVRRMQERLSPIIRTGRPVARVLRRDEAWEVVDHSGRSVCARNVVVACPTFAAACLFRDFDHDLSEAFGSIPYAPIVVAATGHRSENVAHSLSGFGFLIPRSQGIRILGSIWTSSIFEERAPEGYVQFRTMLGGAGDLGAMDLSDDQVLAVVRRELSPLIGLAGEPAFVRIYRWKYGIPQFTLGHRERRARLEQLTAKHPGLHLVGNAYYGVGLNDCVKMAYRLAVQLQAG
jgi:oxygen-dependent protoporphyrinogen oxidase